MVFNLLQVFCETYDLTDVNHTNRSEGVFLGDSIEWE